MNPLSAFSFGKIIKTFIPGLMAMGTVFCFVEYLALRRDEVPPPAAGRPVWDFFLDHSVVLAKLTDPDVGLTLITALLPLALILGFFLNTLHWFIYHDVCWKRVEATLAPGYLRLRDRLDSQARTAFRELAGEPGVEPPKPYLPGFLLPEIDLEKWAYLRESYFAWYEFQVNSVVALALSTMSYAVLLTWIAVRWSLWLDYGLAVVVPSLAVSGVIWGLHRSAMRNLRQYQERTLWYFAGIRWSRRSGDREPTSDSGARPRSAWADLAAAALSVYLRDRRSSREAAGGPRASGRR